MGLEVRAGKGVVTTVFAPKYKVCTSGMGLFRKSLVLRTLCAGVYNHQNAAPCNAHAATNAKAIGILARHIKDDLAASTAMVAGFKFLENECG